MFVDGDLSHCNVMILFLCISDQSACCLRAQQTLTTLLLGAFCPNARPELAVQTHTIAAVTSEPLGSDRKCIVIGSKTALLQSSFASVSKWTFQGKLKLKMYIKTNTYLIRILWSNMLINLHPLLCE